MALHLFLPAMDLALAGMAPGAIFRGASKEHVVNEDDPEPGEKGDTGQ